MKFISLCALTFTFLASASTTAWGQDPGGTWTLKIENLQHKVITTATVRFAKERDDESCMGGNWKRVIVDSSKTTDANFFPISERLSYSLSYGVEKGGLTIGRNGICDAYLHLSGKLDNGTYRGDYISFGLGGGNKIGYFSASRR